jgi:hypothetical protein
LAAGHVRRKQTKGHDKPAEKSNSQHLIAHDFSPISMLVPIIAATPKKNKSNNSP